MHSHQLTRSTGIDVDTLFSSLEFSPLYDLESLHHTHRMADTRSCAGTSEIFFPAKTDGLFNEQITVQPGMPDHRKTCFELVPGRKRWHRYCCRNTMRAESTFTGKRTSEQVWWSPCSHQDKREACVFDVGSHWQEQDQFKWTITVQEVVMSGDTDGWLSDIPNNALHINTP